MASNTEALKPCPCCNGIADFDHDEDGWNWIQCEGCGLSSVSMTHSMEDCHHMLAEKWNRRAEQPSTAGMPAVQEPHPPSRGCWCAECQHSFPDVPSDGEIYASTNTASKALIDERARFEAEYANQYPATTLADPSKFSLDNYGTYKDVTVQVAWTLWQAAIQLRQPAGWKLVPVEPNDDMQAAGAKAVRFDTTVLNKIWMSKAAYKAMLEAAPLPPNQKDEKNEN